MCDNLEKSSDPYSCIWLHEFIHKYNFLRQNARIWAYTKRWRCLFLNSPPAILSLIPFGRVVFHIVVTGLWASVVADCIMVFSKCRRSVLILSAFITSVTPYSNRLQPIMISGALAIHIGCTIATSPIIRTSAGLIQKNSGIRFILPAETRHTIG